jgi:hypothetical protein
MQTYSLSTVQALALDVVQAWLKGRALAVQPPSLMPWALRCAAEGHQRRARLLCPRGRNLSRRQRRRLCLLFCGGGQQRQSQLWQRGWPAG